MAEHTRTPWDKDSRFRLGPRFDTDDQSDGMLDDVLQVYGANSEADAAFVLKAVNSHDALVKALTKARARIHYLGAAAANEKHFVSNERDFLPEIDALLAEVAP